jgi:hypothetical protein
VKTFKIVSSRFFKYTVHNCYLQSSYCAIAHISNCNLVSIDYISLPLPPLYSPQALVTTISLSTSVW